MSRRVKSRDRALVIETAMNLGSQGWRGRRRQRWSCCALLRPLHRARNPCRQDWKWMARHTNLSGYHGGAVRRVLRDRCCPKLRSSPVMGILSPTFSSRNAGTRSKAQRGRAWAV